MDEDDTDPHVVVVQFPRSAFTTSKQAARFTYDTLTAAGQRVGVTAEEKETGR